MIWRYIGGFRTPKQGLFKEDWQKNDFLLFGILFLDSSKMTKANFSAKQESSSHLTVWFKLGSRKWHTRANCYGANLKISLTEAINQGLNPCVVCQQGL